ncbi:23S rRNA (adenine(2030)-N(6))-methyltransferase RlmJ [Caulobacter sp. KR2-114]|uniref:23S rRNA (adenine(2030)-N(6))-methyltransferase RlmJ n=1 Tax=Caulobacter sp. KR2-114 TaxID=3400912 RepID=UPI003C02A9CD
MNYRHAFHAGNFADLLKHAIVLDLLRRLTAAGAPLTVVDTHAGAGAYDLTGALARKTGEAEAGIGRLMADAAAPAVFGALKAAVARLNPQPAGASVPVRRYPGSPLLIAQSLRPGDRYLGCELRPDDGAALRENLKGRAGAEARMADGWATAPAETRVAARAGRRVLVLIDPPFERGDDYPALALATHAILAADPAAVVAIWTPLKDLATFDRLLGEVEDAALAAAGAAAPAVLVSEVRLRPLADPMRMNGCAMLVLNPPDGVEAQASAAAAWIAAHCGEAAARADTRRL